MIGEIFLWTIGLYILYKLVFDFILPIARTTNTVRKQFKNVQEQMNAHQQQYSTDQGNYNNTSSSTHSSFDKHSKPVGAKEDYIDFEEVK